MKTVGISEDSKTAGCDSVLRQSLDELARQIGYGNVNDVIAEWKRTRAVDLPTEEQLIGAVKATWMLVEDGIISASRAAELCGIKMLEYRIIAKKHCARKED